MSQLLPSKQEVNSWMLWKQLLAGPILWSVHFILSYLLVETICQAGWKFNILRINGLSLILIMLTLLAVICTGLFGLKSYRAWRNINRGRSLKDQFHETSHWFERPVEFMYFSGFLLSTLFAVTILMVGAPAFFLQPCS
jgi:hypothetical protein